MVQIAVPCVMDDVNKPGNLTAFNMGYVTRSNTWGGADPSPNPYPPDLKYLPGGGPQAGLNVAQWTGDGPYNTGLVIPNSKFANVTLDNSGSTYSGQFTLGAGGNGPYVASPWPIMVGDITVSYNVFSAFGNVTILGRMEMWDANFNRVAANGGNLRILPSHTTIVVPMNTFTRVSYVIDRNALLTGNSGGFANTKYITLNDSFTLTGSTAGPYGGGRFVYNSLWYGDFDVAGSASLRTIYPGLGGTKTSSLYRYKNTTNPTDVG